MTECSTGTVKVGLGRNCERARGHHLTLSLRRVRGEATLRLPDPGVERLPLDSGMILTEGEGVWVSVEVLLCLLQRKDEVLYSDPGLCDEHERTIRNASRLCR